MAPDVLVTDELGGIGDAQAVLEAAQSGVAVMTSVHGNEVEGLAERSSLYHLIRNHVFSVYAVMDAKQPGKIHAVYDGRMQLIPMGGNA
jgi:stage III sporulation protein AA